MKKLVFGLSMILFLIGNNLYADVPSKRGVYAQLKNGTYKQIWSINDGESAIWFK